MSDPSPQAIVIGGGCVGISTALELSKIGYLVTVIERFPLAAQFCSMGNAGVCRNRIHSSKWKSIHSDYNLPSLITGAFKSLLPTFKPNYNTASFIDPLFFTDITSYKWAFSLFKSKWRGEPDKALIDSLEIYCYKSWISNAKYIRNITGKDYLQYPGYAAIYPPFSVMSLINPSNIYKEVNLVKSKDVKVDIPISTEDPIRYDMINDTKIESFPNALNGDCHSFSNTISQLKDIHFRCNTEAQKILIDQQNNVHGVMLNDDNNTILKADKVVICGGVLTNDIVQNKVYQINEKTNYMKKVRLPYIPIVPLQGYSITIPYAKDKYPYPYHATVYNPSHVYVVQINDNMLRFTSYGYFRSTKYAQKLWNTMQDTIEAKEGIQSNISDSTKFEIKLWENFEAVIKDNLLELYDIDQDYFDSNKCKWKGLRPYTPDGLPIVDKIKSINGLYINAGHGQLGWNRCHGTAKLIANMVDNNNNNEIEKDILRLLTLDRF